MVSLTLLAQDSASARLQGVSYGRAASPDADLLPAILAAATSDSSANVRLAALDALRPASDEVAVRAALLDRLATDPSPLVQIAIVDLLLGTARHGAAMAPAAGLPPLAPTELDRLLALATEPGDGVRPRDDLDATVRDHLRSRLRVAS